VPKPVSPLSSSPQSTVNDNTIKALSATVIKKNVSQNPNSQQQNGVQPPNRILGRQVSAYARGSNKLKLNDLNSNSYNSNKGGTNRSTKS